MSSDPHTRRLKAVADFFDERARGGDLLEFTPEQLEKLDALAPRLDLRPGQWILEPGCGSGRLTAWLAERLGEASGGRIDAFDISPGMLVYARRRGLPPCAHFTQCAVEDMPFAEAAYDRVICFFVFPHFDEPAAALEALARRLKPDGRLWIIHFDSREELNARHAGHGGAVAGHMLPNEARMRELFAGAGLQAVNIEDRPGLYTLEGIRR